MLDPLSQASEAMSSMDVSKKARIG